jgi:predicted DNA-binding transcriptional regulator YafY
MNADNPERLRERFAYIETELFWGDGITAGQLARTFEITRQMAQKIIGQYRQQYPRQMRYVAKSKRHEATESFEPVFIRPSPHAFLDYLRGQALVGLYREDKDWSELTVTDVDRLLRPELPLIPLKQVLRALRCQKTVTIDYWKKDLEPGSISIRVISPNHLIYAEGRYHIRAYCHMKNLYRDFVLSRIVHASPSLEDWISSEYDREWNEFVETKLRPNPSLPLSVQNAVLKGFEVAESGIRTLKCRKALLFYLKRRLLSEDAKYGMPLWCILPEE